MAASSGDCQALCQPAPTLTPTELVSKEPTSFMIIPPEARQKIYNHTFAPEFSNRRSGYVESSSVSKLSVHSHQIIPIALLLTSKQLKQEISQHYWNTTVFRIDTQDYHSPEEYKNNLCAQMKHLQAMLTPFCKLPIQLWELRLLFGWTIPLNDYDKDDDDKTKQKRLLLLHDALLWMLSQQTSTIRNLELIIPCLCSRVYGFENRRRLTPETWASTFLPILEPLLSQLRIQGSVTFTPTCQESFPPCPLKKCKALVHYLQDVKSIVEGDTPVTTTECPTEKYRCGRWRALNDSGNGHPVDCGCDEVSRVEFREEKLAKYQEIREWQECCDSGRNV